MACAYFSEVPDDRIRRKLFVEVADYLQRLLPITCQDHKLSSTSKDFSTPEAGSRTKFPKASNPTDPIDLHQWYFLFVRVRSSEKVGCDTFPFASVQ